MAAAGPVLGLFALVGAALLVGYVAHRLFLKFRVSDVFILLLVGLAVGPVFGLVDGSLLAPAIPFLSPLALVVVLFEGGLDLAWDDIRRHAGRALVLSLATWTLTALLVAAVMHLLLGFPVILAILFGCCVAATGMLVVIPLLGQLDAPPWVRVMLTVETSLGDLLSAVVVSSISGILVLGATPAEGALLFASQSVIGAAVGLLAGIVCARVLALLPAEKHGYPMTLAALMLAYAAAETLHGSGFIMALVFGLFVGNAGPLMRLGGLRGLASLPERMRLHQSEFIFLLRSVYFVFLGMTIGREVLTWPYALAGAALLAAMVAARILAVRLTTPAPTPQARLDRLLLTAMMPRGLATAVIAAIPVSMGVPGAEPFLAYTFLVILGADVATSIGLYLYSRRHPAAAPSTGTSAPHGG